MSPFNLFKKPKLAPPIKLTEPDFKKLDELRDKYQNDAKKFANLKIGNTISWWQIKEAMDDLFFLELNGISFFIENVLCQGSKKKKEYIYERVRLSSDFAASSGWIVGREWATSYPKLYYELKDKNSIDTDDIPADALILLGDAQYYIYSLFFEIFTIYYDSNYGRRTHHQKDAHLKSTYQSFMKGINTCFLSGVKSLNYK